MHFYCLPIIMLTLHILSLFIYTYLMCLYLCISDVPHGIRNKELELENKNYCAAAVKQWKAKTHLNTYRTAN